MTAVMSRLAGGAILGLTDGRVLVTARRLLVLASGAAALLAVLAATGVASFFRAEQARLARARHAARGETELRIVNPAGALISLQRAGDSLEQAAAVALAKDEVWLAEGRYFVEADAAG